MKENVFKKLSGLFFVTMLIFSIGLLGFGSKADAVVAKPTEGKLYIHKLQFGGAVDLPPIAGDGTEITSLPPNADPAPDVDFVIVSTKGSNLTGNPSQEEAMAYYNSVKGNPDVVQEIGKTDENGLYVSSSLPADQYMIIEITPALGVTSIAAPVMVSIPIMSLDGRSWNNNVHVYTKNAVVLGAARAKKLDQNNQPLIGATFSLYRKGTQGQADSLELGNLVSGSDGYTDVVGNLVAGDYYFIETKSPDKYLLEGKKLEFTVTATNHAYDIDGKLDMGKVITKDLVNYLKPNLTKTRLTPESTDIGKIVSWNITTDVPKNIKNYKKYVVTDTLDSRLTYLGNPKVMLDNAELNPAYYSLTNSNGVVKVEFISDLFPGAPDKLLEGSKLIITFDTMVNPTALPGVEIPNNAILAVNNSYVDATSTEANPPKVETGARKFLKVNPAQQPLAGAEFVIYKKVDDVTQYMKKNEDKTISWVDNKSEATVLSTQEDGKFEVYGLAYGAYYLEEIKAPTGYNLLTADKQFTVDKGSYFDDAVLIVMNTNAPVIPITGGIGTILFFAIGLILMGMVYFFYRRYEKQVV